MYQIKELLKYKELVQVMSDVQDGDMSFKRLPAKQIKKKKRIFLEKNRIKADKVVEFVTEPAKIGQIREVLSVNSQNTLDAKALPVLADALITNKPNIFLAIYPADCYGVLIYDKTNRVISLIHVGYKQIDQNIINKTLFFLKNKYKINLKTVLAAIYPGICSNCLKIDEKIFKRKDFKKYCTKNKEESCLDLKRWIIDDLKKNKIKNIHKSRYCTYCSQQKKFFSHRRQKIKKEPYARNMLIAGLKY